MPHVDPRGLSEACTQDHFPAHVNRIWARRWLPQNYTRDRRTNVGDWVPWRSLVSLRARELQGLQGRNTLRSGTRLDVCSRISRYTMARTVSPMICDHRNLGYSSAPPR